MDEDRAERLYAKALLIQEGKALGLWLPIMQHLALRKYGPAMVELAAWLSDSGLISDLGSPATGNCAAGLYHRAWRQGEGNAAQHMAMSRFNLNDLAGYRMWLRRAAKLDQPDCAAELRRFETRLPHGAARRIRRKRPWLKREG